jgi:hypothetical protein
MKYFIYILIGLSTLFLTNWLFNHVSPYASFALIIITIFFLIFKFKPKSK